MWVTRHGKVPTAETTCAESSRSASTRCQPSAGATAHGWSLSASAAKELARSVPTTSWPAARNLPTAALPDQPAAPVTSTRMAVCRGCPRPSNAGVVRVVAASGVVREGAGRGGGSVVSGTGRVGLRELE